MSNAADFFIYLGRFKKFLTYFVLHIFILKGRGSMGGRAIVLVSFGSAERSVWEGVFEKLAGEIRNAFAGFDIFHAFTSEFMVKRAAAQGLRVFNLPCTLELLAKKNYGEVFLQPLHFTAGEEFQNKIIPAYNDYKGRFARLSLGSALIMGAEDCAQMADFLISLNGDDAREVVYMGHGSPHIHNPFYEEIQRQLDARVKNITVGVLEENDSPNIFAVLARLEKKKAREVILKPLLITQGRHVVQDMAGDDAASWKSRLLAKGFSVVADLTTLGEIAAFRELYCEKIGALIKS